jgi:serine protease inhibitor
VIAGSNRFALDLLHGVVAEDTGANVFLSPLSASMALGMTMGGARGDTFEGMRAVLGFGSLHRDEINSSYRTLNDPVHGSGGRST